VTLFLDIARYFMISSKLTLSTSFCELDLSSFRLLMASFVKGYTANLPITFEPFTAIQSSITCPLQL